MGLFKKRTDSNALQRRNQGSQSEFLAKYGHVLESTDNNLKKSSSKTLTKYKNKQAISNLYNEDKRDLNAEGRNMLAKAAVGNLVSADKANQLAKYYEGSREPLVNKVLLKWKAPDRLSYYSPFGRRVTMGSITLTLALYFWWIGQPFISLGVAAIFFLYYVIFSIPPVIVEHSIETAGIRSFGRLYPWYQLKEFYFVEQEGHLLLYVNTYLKLPARLIFIVEDIELARKLIDIVSRYIPYKVMLKQQSAFNKAFEGKYLPPEIFEPVEE